ncbi:MAG: PDZ domain-containing protein [Pirellulales bacterium]
MRVDDLRDRLATLALVVVILGSGASLRAQENKSDNGEPEDMLFFFAEGNPESGGPFKVQLSDHWLGIAGDSADDVLRAQLKLPEGQGYVVTQIQPASPAEKAHLEKNDVLLSIGDKNIGALPDLVAVIEDNKDKELELTLLRGGERRILKVTPTKRPEPAAPGDQPDVRRAVGKWINRMPGNPEGRMRMFNFGPGMVWNQAGGGGFFVDQAEFPKDLTVTITKSGSAPAEIVAKQGDKEWKTTDEKLDDLPEEIRSHVSGLFGRPQFAVRHVAPQVWNAPAPGRVEWSFAEPQRRERLRARGADVNERLDHLREQLDNLKQQLDDLREEPAPSAGVKVEGK